MEREEGEDSQLLHTPTSNTGTLCTFIHPGGGSPCHNNNMERRKKNYPTEEERLQLTRITAQKMLEVTLPKRKQNKIEQNSGNSVREQGTNFTGATEIGCHFYTHNMIQMTKEGDSPMDNDGNTKKIPRRPSNP